MKQQSNQSLRGAIKSKKLALRKVVALVGLTASVQTVVLLSLMSVRFDPMFSTMQNVRPNLAKESWRASSQHLPCRCRKGGSNLTMQTMVGSVALDHTSHRSRIQSAIG